MYSLINMADTSNENSKKNDDVSGSVRSRGMTGPGAPSSEGNASVQASSTNNNNPVRSRTSGSNAQNTTTTATEGQSAESKEEESKLISIRITKDFSCYD